MGTVNHESFFGVVDHRAQGCVKIPGPSRWETILHYATLVALALATLVLVAALCVFFGTGSDTERVGLLLGAVVFIISKGTSK